MIRMALAPEKLRVIIRRPGAKPERALVPAKKIYEMASRRGFCITSRLAAADEGTGEPAGTIEGIPVRGMVVIYGIALRDGWLMPYHIPDDMTPETCLRRLHWCRPKEKTRRE